MPADDLFQPSEVFLYFAGPVSHSEMWFDRESGEWIEWGCTFLPQLAPLDDLVGVVDL